MQLGSRFRANVIAVAAIIIAAACLVSTLAAGTSAPARRPAEKVVYLVPDLPTFVYYLSTWDGNQRFPIFMTRNKYFDRFVLAYKPDRVLRSGPKKIERLDENLFRAAVCAAWGKETIDDLPRGISRNGFKERLDRAKAKANGIVLTKPDATQLAAGLALAAAHCQALDFLRLPSPIEAIKPTGTITSEQKEQLRKEIIKIIERWGYRYEQLGDDIDYITLALDLPMSYMGLDSVKRTQQRLCLDDGINRLTPDGSVPSAKNSDGVGKTESQSSSAARDADQSKKGAPGKKPGAGGLPRGDCYAYVGRLLEADEGMSLYQAMCSIFLGTTKALYFDRWPEDWGLRCQEGWWVMQTKIHSVLVKKSESSIAKWKQLVGKLNPYGFLQVNSAGGARQWGDGKVSDIPESVPVVVYFAHSFSASNPYDETTIAGRWLRNGAYIYFGALSEPFGQSFNASWTVAVSAVAGEPLGKSFQAKAMLHPRFTFPWKQIYIGDPLHRMVFLDDPNETPISRKFRQAVRTIRQMKLGPAIETLEEALESAQDAPERDRLWQVLNKTFRLRFFALRTRREPIESNFDLFFIDSWYNDTYHPNGQPTSAVVFDKRLNLFQVELLRLYGGLFRTIENKPRLKEYLSSELGRMKKDAAFAKIWLCVAPFSKSDEASPENPFDPKKVLRLGSTWETRSGKIGWQAAMVNPDDNRLNLAALYQGSDSVIYAACLPVLDKDKAVPVRLHVAATDSLEVWLNNAVVGSVSPAAAGKPREGSLDFQLQPGENLLFLKVFRKGKSCSLSARLTDLKGEFIEELSFADVVARLSASGVKIDPERYRPGTEAGQRKMQ